MRTLILLFTAAAISISSFGQISLDQNDFPSLGLELTMYQVFDNGTGELTDSVNVGSAGASQSYDISSIFVFNHDSSVQDYMDPQETGYSTAHPQAEVAVFEDLETDSASGDTLMVSYDFFDVTTSHFAHSGSSIRIDTAGMFGGGPSGNYIEVHVQNAPADPIATTQFQMGHMTTDSSSWNVTIGPLYHRETFIRVVEVDGWGTLQTPNGARDVLRVELMEIEQNFTQVNGNVDEDETDTTYYFEFWAKGIGQAIARVEMQSDWQTVLQVEYTRVSKAGQGYPTGVERLQNTEMSTYPNPARNHVTLQIGSPIWTDQIRMIDAIGKEVKFLASSRDGLQWHLNVSGLDKGVYFLIVSDSEGKPAKTSRVVINR